MNRELTPDEGYSEGKKETSNVDIQIEVPRETTMRMQQSEIQMNKGQSAGRKTSAGIVDSIRHIVEPPHPQLPS